MPRTTLAAALAITALLLPSAGHATGPALETDPAALAQALECPNAFAAAGEPVLLVHGTAITAEESWSWNYAAVLPDEGYDVCTVLLPDRALGDIQVAAEYVVHAIREINAATGRLVDVIGHSQGGLEPRWAVRWWPDVRDAVDDLVMLATPNHGTLVADAGCVQECPPAVWQMTRGSTFLAALNAGDETPGGLSYTNIYSANDELVQPQAPASTSALTGASNILVQEFCPGRPLHHVGLVHDGAVYALVVDALAGDGPADPGRVDRVAACTTGSMPGVSASDAVSGNATVYGNGFGGFAEADRTPEEPPLKDYASGG